MLLMRKQEGCCLICQGWIRSALKFLFFCNWIFVQLPPLAKCFDCTKFRSLSSSFYVLILTQCILIPAIVIAVRPRLRILVYKRYSQKVLSPPHPPPPIVLSSILSTLRHFILLYYLLSVLYIDQIMFQIVKREGLRQTCGDWFLQLR